jgi:hypothetical protein
MDTIQMFAFVAGTGTPASSHARADRREAPMDDMPSASDRNLDHQPGWLSGLGEEGARRSFQAKRRTSEGPAPYFIRNRRLGP